MTGQGLNVAATTLTLVQTSPQGNAAFGQTVTITATIASTTSGTPTGDIIFYVDGNFYSVSKVSGPTASVNITGLLGGTHTIAASYTGDNTFASSNATLSITVVKAGSTIAVTGAGGAVFQFPTSAVAGSSVTLTAVITPNATTVPTGTVTFTVGSLNLGMASVVTANGGYQASVTTTALPAGTNTVVASYSGDVNYAPSTGTLTFITSPQTYSLTPSSLTVTMGPVATSMVPLISSSISGFGTAYVSLTCSGLPANTTCGFNPNGFVLQAGNLLTVQQTNPTGTIVLVPATYGATNIQLNITTGNTPPVIPQPITAGLRLPGLGNTRVPAGLAFLAIMPLSLLLRRRSKLARSLRLLSLFILLGAGFTALNGCGSNLIGTTPAGTYHVIVTATATDNSYTGSLAPGCTVTPASATYPTCVQTAQITLVVQ